MSRRAFTIEGTVNAETTDEALRALSAYCDPDNKEPDEAYPLRLVESIVFHWEPEAWTEP